MRMIAIVVIMTAINSLPATAAECLSYEPAKVTVTGTLSLTQFYGPPNYGEDPSHDRKDYLPVLTLDKPFCVDANTSVDSFDVAENNVQQLQLIYVPTILPFNRSWVGRHIAVTGELMHAENAQHHTPVLVQVTATRVLSN